MTFFKFNPSKSMPSAQAMKLCGLSALWMGGSFSLIKLMFDMKVAHMNQVLAQLKEVNPDSDVTVAYQSKGYGRMGLGDEPKYLVSPK